MLKRALRHVRDGLISLGYPEECRVCGNAIESWDDGVACHRCWCDPAVTRVFSGVNGCPRCGIPNRAYSAQQRNSQPSEHLASADCGECQTRPYLIACACGEYSGAIEVSVLFLKIHPLISPRVRELISQTIVRDASILASDLVLPVPLHRKRKRERGFNQARLIANLVAKTLGRGVRDDVLARVKYTERHRAGMDASDRARSVEKAFKVVRPDVVRGRSVLIVDDLYTTGSTVCAATRDLIAAGAARVNVFTLARVATAGKAVEQFRAR